MQEWVWPVGSATGTTCWIQSLWKNVSDHFIWVCTGKCNKNTVSDKRFPLMSMAYKMDTIGSKTHWEHVTKGTGTGKSRPNAWSLSTKLPHVATETERALKPIFHLRRQWSQTVIGTLSISHTAETRSTSWGHLQLLIVSLNSSHTACRLVSAVAFQVCVWGEFKETPLRAPSSTWIDIKKTCQLPGKLCIKPDLCCVTSPFCQQKTLNPKGSKGQNKPKRQWIHLA